MSDPSRSSPSRDFQPRPCCLAAASRKSRSSWSFLSWSCSCCQLPPRFECLLRRRWSPWVSDQRYNWWNGRDFWMEKGSEIGRGEGQQTWPLREAPRFFHRNLWAKEHIGHPRWCSFTSHSWLQQNSYSKQGSNVPSPPLRTSSLPLLSTSLTDITATFRLSSLASLQIALKFQPPYA